MINVALPKTKQPTDNPAPTPSKKDKYSRSHRKDANSPRINRSIHRATEFSADKTVKSNDSGVKPEPKWVRNYEK